MNKKDWIEYFEAVNSRSPEEADFKIALENGEFVEEVSETVDFNQSQVTSQPQVQEQMEVKPETSQQVQPTQFQQNTSNVNQQVYNEQVATPSAFTVFWKQFWHWLVMAWKTPTLEQMAHRYNGLTAYCLLTFFTTLTFTAKMIVAGWITFSNFLTLLIGVGFVYFAFILGGFIVKTAVYQEKSFTLIHSFDWFGRLLSLPLMFFALASFFALLNVNTVAFLLSLLSYFILVSATNYTLFHTTNYSKTDMFYKYLLATLVYAIIIIVFFLLGGMVAGELLFNYILGGLNNFGGYYGGFGY